MGYRSQQGPLGMPSNEALGHQLGTHVDKGAKRTSSLYVLGTANKFFALSQTSVILWLVRKGYISQVTVYRYNRA